MGVHGQASNIKMTTLGRRKRHRAKSVFKMKRQKRDGGPLKRVGELPEIVTKGILYKRRTNKRANVQMSNKKKRKIERHMRRAQKEKAQMDVEDMTEATPSKASASKAPASKAPASTSTDQPRDIEMNNSAGLSKKAKKRQGKKSKQDTVESGDMDCDT